MSKSTIQTASGGYFDFADPRPEAIHVGDIALALSRVNRFAGHTRRPYSVAEHSVRVSTLVSPEFALWGLLHDATEAYMADVPSPLKRLCPDYKRIEARVMLTICKRFGLAPVMPRQVHAADARLLVTEKRDLLPYTDQCVENWLGYASVSPLPGRIRPFEAPEQAEAAFLARFASLAKGK